jgi:RNA polymerase sigma-54 factor
MKQGLSLRVSQHLALTPQLQQSIRLLQLSTLELSQEIDQMLDDNPFLEKEMEDLAPREDFGLEQENSQAASSDAEPESWDGPMDRVSEVRVETASETTAPVDAEGKCEGRGGREPPALYLRTAFGHNALNPGVWGRSPRDAQ